MEKRQNPTSNEWVELLLASGENGSESGTGASPLSCGTGAVSARATAGSASASPEAVASILDLVVSTSAAARR